MDSRTAERLGAKAGAEIVDLSCADYGIGTLGRRGWDEGAVNNAVHRIDGVPDDLAEVYYAAYEHAAIERYDYLRAKAESDPCPDCEGSGKEMVEEAGDQWERVCVQCGGHGSTRD
jgi:hypothetical protein